MSGRLHEKNYDFIIPEEEQEIQENFCIFHFCYISTLISALAAAPHRLPCSKEPLPRMTICLTRKNRGTILVLTLMLISVMALLAVSHLLLGTQDYRVAKGEEWSDQTFYLARSGLEYYALNQAAMPPGTRQKIAVEEGALYFDIEVTDTEVIATGIIADSSGRALAKKSLRARLGDVGRWYEAASP